MVDNDFFHLAEDIDPDWNPGMKEPVLMLTVRERWVLGQVIEMAEQAIEAADSGYEFFNYDYELDWNPSEIGALKRKVLGRT